jgi:hypothetical protein
LKRHNGARSSTRIGTKHRTNNGGNREGKNPCHNECPTSHHTPFPASYTCPRYRTRSKDYPS